jgi:hypothetical protein
LPFGNIKRPKIFYFWIRYGAVLRFAGIFRNFVSAAYLEQFLDDFEVLKLEVRLCKALQ